MTSPLIAAFYQKNSNVFFSFISKTQKDSRFFLSFLPETSLFEVPELIKKNVIDFLLVNIPLTRPFCWDCSLLKEKKCPGENYCPVLEVKEIKKYLKEKSQKILKKNIRKKLNSSFSPYLYRYEDAIILGEFWEELLDLKILTYPFVSSLSLSTLSSWNYLQGQLNHLPIFESYFELVLVQLVRAKVIESKDIHECLEIETGVLRRMKLVTEIERKLQLVMTQNDYEKVILNTNFFKAFLMACCAVYAYPIEKRPSFLREGLLNFNRSTKLLIPCF